MALAPQVLIDLFYNRGNEFSVQLHPGICSRLCPNQQRAEDFWPQSSEPFDSPYERVLGAKYDILACVYNGKEFLHLQTATSLQITAAMYYERSEVADQILCASARLLRELV